RWESRGCHISCVACRGVALAKTGQGFALKYYSFTLDALDLPAETGSTSGILNFCNVRVNLAVDSAYLNVKPTFKNY
ncbi:MAG: hypothetical protein K8R45_11640, partial [Desulfobacterales bacterium]|nr:hypothetical protein [Desulfobacterales bacterium]